ncbi:malonate decarboxylase holo-[acyl-carrier-protein] synthase [Aquabacterium sp. J223]|uniref:malonate decarboxylase holo-[acyl-carrier-protein] synthase n=1 Tax=Aquabacterium sp. J223 TaxID=2898431 RepID=UPI0021ADAFDC|nr:malonate decarboxylase holo-[acyl-carrier-protein] synthase [Aquabacterium sp. J223]UUX96945.1 malonate decarboxylase holo-[acyl-carrier-protein] synthase [Aquabacterium sp. J223]
MPPLQRHRLVWLSAAAWARWHDRAPAAERPLLDAWRDADRPLVVARPTQPLPAGALALGLPAPARFDRRRVALVAQRDEVVRAGHFPSLHEVAMAQAWTGAAALAQQLSLCARVRVYGSHGWQHLTGERYVHPGSDLDLLVELAHADQAPAVIDGLQAADLPMRLDGELVLPDGRAVPWREWAALLQGRVAQVLVKSMHGVSLCDATALQAVPA